MEKIYSGTFNIHVLPVVKSPTSQFLNCRMKLLMEFVFLFCFLQLIIPLASFSQKLEFSYSYFNLTRNNGGGTLEQGDTIEIHALIKINNSSSNTYYVDTIPVGTKFISNSLKLVTNEGLLYPGSGPYTDASNDDAGVYDVTVPGVRVNLGTGFSKAQSGINFGSITGGGTVLAGSVPKFYGSTLFIVAYRLLITANNGDTIHPTGNYHIDTSGVNKTFRFNYAGIKVIKNQALCNNFSSATFTAESSFGSGNIQNRALGVNAPGYIKKNLDVNNPQDNYYSIVNNTSANGTTNNAGPYQPTANPARVFNGFWDIIGDHTGAANQLTGNLPVAAGQPGGICW